MPILSNIRKLEFRNQLRNGDDFTLNPTDFTTNFVAVVGERIQATIQVDVSWYANATAGNSWTITAGQISRVFGDFSEDGFQVGDTFEFYPDWLNNSGSEEFVGEITGITQNGTVLSFTVISGTQTTTGFQDSQAGIWAQADLNTIAPDALIYRYAFAPANNSFSSVGLLTPTSQSYFALSIDLTGATTSIMNGVGSIRDFESGGATADRVLLPVKNATVYEIVHEFVFNPFYLTDWFSDLTGGTVPTDWQNDWAYTFEMEFRNGLTNAVGAKVITENTPVGATGFFDEAAGGFGVGYSVSGSTYTDTATTDPATAIQRDRRTELSFTLSRVSGAFSAGQEVVMHFAYLPPNESGYQLTPTTLEENFLYNTLRLTEGGGATVGTGPIQTGTAALNAGDIDISIEVEFTSAQRVQVGDTGRFLVWVVVEDATLSPASTDRIALIAGVGEIQNETVTTLATFSRMNILQHQQEAPGAAGSSVQVTAWPEDGVLLNFEFSTDQSLNAQIESFTVMLVARNSSGDYFVLDENPFNLSGAVQIGNVQQIDVDTTRGYLLPSGDQFNWVKLGTDSLVGTDQFYSGWAAQKVKWQVWVPNPDVPTAFYDISEPNNNRNFGAVNYSNQLGYEVFIMAIIESTGESSDGFPLTGRDIGLSPELSLLDYGVSDSGYTGVISTHNPSTGANLSGLILSNQTTLFRTTWSGAGSSLADLYIIHRIQKFESPGDDIEEISSLYVPLSPQILIPDTGQTRLNVYASGADLVSECLIDPNQLGQGKYNLSARIERFEAAANFVVSQDGCDLVFTVVGGITGILQVDYAVIVGGTTAETLTDVGTPATWDAAALFDSETVEIQQTITTTSGVLITSDTINVPDFADSCRFVLNSNMDGASTFDPALDIPAGQVAYWRLPDNVVRTGNLSLLGSDAGFNGTTQTVYLTATDGPSVLSEPQFSNDSIVGVLDFTNGPNPDPDFDVSQNGGLTGLIFAANSQLFTDFNASRCGLVNNLDLSPLSRLAGELDLSRNSGLQSVTFPVTSDPFSRIDMSRCGFTVIDFTNLTAFSPRVDIRQNESLISVTFPSVSLTTIEIDIRNCDITGTLNFVPLSNLGGQIEFSNNPNLTGVNFPASPQAITVLDGSICGITGTLTLTSLTGLRNRIIFSDNSGITSVLFPSISANVNILRFGSCNISGTLNISMLTDISGEVDFSNNMSITGLTLPPSSGTIDEFNFSLCSLPYVDLTGLTFSSSVLIRLDGNAMSVVEVNHYLVDLDSSLPNPGTGEIQIGGTNAAPDSSTGGYNGVAAAASLASKGYTVITS